MYEDLMTIIIGTGIVFSVIGLYLVIRAWVMWSHTPEELIKARIFLNKSFLHNNLKLTFLLGFLVALHLIYELVEVIGLPEALESYEPMLEVFYLILPAASMLILLLLACQWCKFLSDTKQ